MLLSALQSLEVPPGIPGSGRSPEAARAALLYRAGQWDQAHQAVQDLNSPEGSFWHGILHRHEQDWSNAKYWFRQVGQHPVYSLIYQDAVTILSQGKPVNWHLAAEWDPIRFVDWCQQSPENRSVIQIQVAEWQRLFTWCAA